MVRDWLSYLTQPQATRHNLMPGDPISVHLVDAEFKEAILNTPHGDAIELEADLAGEGVVFRSSRTILPGDYSLELGLSGEEIPFHVMRDPLESNLARLSEVDQGLLASMAGLQQTALSANISGSNQSDPVWPILLMSLVALMAAELLLSGIIARQRFGTESISETTEQFSESRLGVPLAFDSKGTSSGSQSRRSRPEKRVGV